MPAVKLLLYREGTRVPVLDYLDGMQPPAREKMRAAMGKLATRGHTAERPLVGHLEADIYELRIRYGSAQHRLLFFFYERSIVILTHGLQKEAVVPPGDIKRARHLRERFLADPGAHSAEE
jgi:phage-related protein